jgi:hypothetical protein
MGYVLTWQRLMTIHDSVHDNGVPAPVTVAEGDLDTMRKAWDEVIGEWRGYGEMRDMDRWATVPGHKLHTDGVRYSLHLIGAGTARVEEK